MDLPTPAVLAVAVEPALMVVRAGGMVVGSAVLAHVDVSALTTPVLETPRELAEVRILTVPPIEVVLLAVDPCQEKARELLLL